VTYPINRAPARTRTPSAEGSRARASRGLMLR